MNESIDKLLRRAASLKREGRDVVACLLIKSRGSTPASAGALMIVDQSAQTYGTIGGGCVEAEVRRAAVAMMQSRQFGVLQLKLDHDYGWDDGLICGGTIHVAIGELPAPEILDAIVSEVERRQATKLTIQSAGEDGPAEFTLDLSAKPRLIIAGAGHVGQALAKLAIDLEFEVTVVDDRADLLEQYFSPPVQTMAGSISDTLRGVPIDDQTYCVIVTRGHRHDEQALEAVLNRGAAYVGMIGSRRKVKLIFDDLAERGMPAAELQKVHAPIGLGIGAVTVPEIALSIAAQLVEVRRERSASQVIGTSAQQSACH